MAEYPYTYHSWSDLQSLGETIAEHVIAKLEKEDIIKQTWDRTLDDYRVQLGAPGAVLQRRRANRLGRLHTGNVRQRVRRQDRVRCDRFVTLRIRDSPRHSRRYEEGFLPR
jgi:hypothetical protein